MRPFYLRASTLRNHSEGFGPLCDHPLATEDDKGGFAASDISDAAGSSPPIAPEIVSLAAFLGGRHGARYLIDVHSDTSFVLRDIGEDWRALTDTGAGGEWIRSRGDLEELVEQSVVICSDVLNRLVDPHRLLAGLASIASRCRAMLLAVPDWELATARMDADSSSVQTRRWSEEEFRELLGRAGVPIAFYGRASSGATGRKDMLLAIVDRIGQRPSRPVPASFRVLAVVTAFNEEDVIVPTISKLLKDGVEVHFIDNWSTDRTLERVGGLAHRGALQVEQFPEGGPSATYDWSDLLQRVDRVAAVSSASWCVHHDADERRLPPWEGVGLRAGLWQVEQSGFNAVDHTVLDFRPIDDNFDAPDDPERYFRHFELGEMPSHFVQIKAWQNQGRSVDLTHSGGHEAVFAGRRVFPYNFLLKHYSIRSQRHGERKVLRERQPRWNPTERAAGWHVHYDHVDVGHRFLRDRAELIDYDTEGRRDYLAEFISHVRVPRTGALIGAEGGSR